MADVFDVANFFITVENRREQGATTNLRLNKLLFFTQVLSLLEHGTPIFCDEFEAWDYGPVIPKVYHEYKKHKNKPIPTPNEEFDLSSFSGEEIRLLFDIYSLYKNTTTAGLVELSHYEDGPWCTARKNENKNTVISLDAIKSFYGPYYNLRKPPRRSDQLLASIPEG